MALPLTGTRTTVTGITSLKPRPESAKCGYLLRVLRLPVRGRSRADLNQSADAFPPNAREGVRRLREKAPSRPPSPASRALSRSVTTPVQLERVSPIVLMSALGSRKLKSSWVSVSSVTKFVVKETAPSIGEASSSRRSGKNWTGESGLVSTTNRF